MEPSDILDEMKKLELSEKIHLAEDIQDDMTNVNLKSPIPEWQRIELDKRSRELMNETLEVNDWKIVHQKIRSKMKDYYD